MAAASLRHCCRPIRDIPPHSIVARHSSPVKAQPLLTSVPPLIHFKKINSVHAYAAYVLQHDIMANTKVRKTEAGRVITNDPPCWYWTPSLVPSLPPCLLGLRRAARDDDLVRVVDRRGELTRSRFVSRSLESRGARGL